MVWCSTGVVPEWCSCGGVFLVVWCSTGVTGVVFLWWWFSGGVVVWWCFCGDRWCGCSCGGVFVMVWWCFCACVFVVVVVFLKCFCVFLMVFLYVFFLVKGRLSSHYREVMQRVLTTLV